MGRWGQAHETPPSPDSSDVDSTPPTDDTPASTHKKRGKKEKKEKKEKKGKKEKKKKKEKKDAAESEEETAAAAAVPQPQQRRPASAAASPTTVPHSAVRSRWGHGAEGGLGESQLRQGGDDVYGGGPQVGFKFGHSEDEAAGGSGGGGGGGGGDGEGEHLLRMSEDGTATDILGLEEAACTSCGHVQGVHATFSPDGVEAEACLPVECAACGATRPLKAWLWASYRAAAGPLEVTATGTTYHVPHYLTRLTDALVYPVLKGATEVVHAHAEGWAPSPEAVSADCSFGRGYVVFHGIGSSVNKATHYMVGDGDRLYCAGSRWQHNAAFASGTALVAMGIQERMQELTARGNRPFAPAGEAQEGWLPLPSALPLGPGWFDNVCQGMTQLSRVNVTNPMPRLHPPPDAHDPRRTPQPSPPPSPSQAQAENATAGDEEALAGSASGAGGHPLLRDGGGGPAAAAAAAPPPPPPPPRGVFERGATTCASAAQATQAVCERLRTDGRAVLEAGAARCCVAVDSLLQGCDGTVEEKLPPMLRLLAAPLEQRLVWDALALAAAAAAARGGGGGDSRPSLADAMSRYFDPSSGLVRAASDPLQTYALGPYDPQLVQQTEKDVFDPSEYVSWSERLRPTVCTTEGPSRRGGQETFQLDVHINDCWFTHHPLFERKQARVARLRHLYSEYQRVAQPGFLDQPKKDDDAAADGGAEPEGGEQEGGGGSGDADDGAAGDASMTTMSPLLRRRTAGFEDGAAAAAGGGGGGGPLQPQAPAVKLSRVSAERRVNDLITHLVKGGLSGAYGSRLQEKAREVDVRWCELPTVDGILGRKTASALQDFLSATVDDAAAAAAAAAAASAGETQGGWLANEDRLSVLPPQMLAALRLWTAIEGCRLLNESTPPEAVLASADHGVPRAWWSEAASLELAHGEGASGYGRTDRAALQCVLRCHFPSAGEVDGWAGSDTVRALQMLLLTTREEVQAALLLPEHIARLEQEMAELRAEVDVLRQLADARRVREAAIEEEVALMREMVEEWRALQVDGGAPEGVSFSLLQRCPLADQTEDQAGGPYALSRLRMKTPQLVIAPSAVPHENNVWYKCKVFVRLRGGDDRERYAAECEWRQMTKGFQVTFGALVRLHLAKEPEAILIQVFNRGRAGIGRGVNCGYVTINPPFDRSPFEPGAMQRTQEGAFLEFGSHDSNQAGMLTAAAFWSQHDPAAPSRAPQPTAATQFPDLKQVVAEVAAGRLDPNDPLQQPLMQRLAERHGAALASRSKRRHVVQQQDGVLASVLLPPAPLPPPPGCVDRTTLLRRRWVLTRAPLASQLTGRLELQLAGHRPKPVPAVPLARDWAAESGAGGAGAAGAGAGGARNEVSSLQLFLDSMEGQSGGGGGGGGASGSEGGGAAAAGGFSTTATDAWLAKIKKARASLVRGVQRDADVLKRVVSQPVLETGRSVFDIIADFFSPITKLRPYRKVADEGAVGGSTGECPSLMIYIKSGRNLPVRCSGHLVEGRSTAATARPRASGFGPAALGLDSPSAAAAAAAAAAGGDAVRSRRERDEELAEADLFVEVRFGPCPPRRSKSVVGPDALFFETLKMPLPIEDCKQDTLALIEDPIEIRVFDKVKCYRSPVDLHRRAEGTTVNYHETKRFLGSCELPFRTLVTSNKMTWEGTLTLDTPCVSLAYSHLNDTPTEGAAAAGAPAAEHVDAADVRRSTISLYISLTPEALRQEETDVFDPLHSLEPAGVFWAAQRWVHGCRGMVRSLLGASTDQTARATRVERVAALVHNTDNQAVLLTRFLHREGLEPPRHVMAFCNQVEPSDADAAAAAAAGGVGGSTLRERVNAPPEYVLARFVSLVPYFDSVVPAAGGEAGAASAGAGAARGDGAAAAAAAAAAARGAAAAARGGVRRGTALDTLAVGGGDALDHALLLANLFLWLSLPPWKRFSEVWVVSGRTDRHPKAAFVLTRDPVHAERAVLWDPLTGERYGLESAACPLKDVSLVFNHTNILCNAQQSGQPRKMAWDLHNARSWRALFGAGAAAPQETVQAAVVHRCLPVDAEIEARLQIHLTDSVKALLKELRSPVRNMLTTFRNLLDIHGRRVLDNVILPSLETAYMEGYGLSAGLGAAGGEGLDAWLEETHTRLLTLHKEVLREALSSYEMHGFPMHFAWKDFASIRKAIVCSGIYLSDPAEKQTEFAIGVHTKGYGRCGSSHYFSVWVYVAVLKRQSSRWP